MAAHQSAKQRPLELSHGFHPIFPVFYLKSEIGLVFSLDLRIHRTRKPINSGVHLKRHMIRSRASPYGSTPLLEGRLPTNSSLSSLRDKKLIFYLKTGGTRGRVITLRQEVKTAPQLAGA